MWGWEDHDESLFFPEYFLVATPMGLTPECASRPIISVFNFLIQEFISCFGIECGWMQIKACNASICHNLQAICFFAVEAGARAVMYSKLECWYTYLVWAWKSYEVTLIWLGAPTKNGQVWRKQLGLFSLELRYEAGKRWGCMSRMGGMVLCTGCSCLGMHMSQSKKKGL